MSECVAKGCINHPSRKGEGTVLEGITYHLFPRNPNQRVRWIKQMNQEGFLPGQKSTLCSLHFIKEYFATDSRGVTHLKPDAIPTEFELENLMESDSDVISCCAPKCLNIYDPTSAITFHPFPLHEPELCDKWLLAMNLTQVAAKKAVLCSVHFDESCFVEENDERLIVPDAVPSIFQYNDETEATEEVDPLSITRSNALEEKFNLTSLEAELVQKHDDLVLSLNEESQRLLDLGRKRAKLEKEKKNIDFLLQAILNGGPLEKSKLRGLAPLIKTVDEQIQATVADCLAPCVAVAMTQESHEMQELPAE